MSVDASPRFGVTTGISAQDRATTVRTLVDPASIGADLRHGGHVFPLRARDGEGPGLADHFARRMAAELEWEGWPGFSPAAAARLASHDWPGNVRELRNVVERAVYRWDNARTPVDTIEFDPFASPWRPPSAAAAAPANDISPAKPGVPAPAVDSVDDLRAAMDAHERAILEATLLRCRYNQRDAARALSLSYDQLRHALRRHGMLEKKSA